MTVKYSAHGLVGLRHKKGFEFELPATDPEASQAHARARESGALLDHEEAEELQRERPELSYYDAIACVIVTRFQRTLRPSLFFTVRVFETEKGKELHIKLEPPPPPPQSQPQPQSERQLALREATPTAEPFTSESLPPPWPAPGWERPPDRTSIVHRNDKGQIERVETFENTANGKSRDNSSGRRLM